MAVIHFSSVERKEKKCVIHFYHKDFKRCEIMSQHLEVIYSLIGLKPLSEMHILIDHLQKILLNAFPEGFRGERPLACREIRNQGVALRYLFHRWCFQGPVGSH